MRITDDRYEQQRLALEVAMRMIAHQARSATIVESTGVSEDRIRKLHRSYFDERRVQRKRGKSPQTIEGLTRNRQTRADASIFASILHATGVLDQLMERERFDVHAAARICDAYDLFLEVRPVLNQKVRFTFEHGWYLIKHLLRSDEIATAPCARCEGLMIVDLYGEKRSSCVLCEIRRQGEPREAPERRRTRALSNQG